MDVLLALFRIYFAAVRHEQLPADRFNSLPCIRRMRHAKGKAEPDPGPLATFVFVRTQDGA